MAKKRKKTKRKAVKKVKRVSKKRKKLHRSKRPLKHRPLSQGFLLVGILGTIIASWWTYFGFEGKYLPMEWGITFIIIFIIMVIASFRSVEIS